MKSKTIRQHSYELVDGHVHSQRWMYQRWEEGMYRWDLSGTHCGTQTMKETNSLY